MKAARKGAVMRKRRIVRGANGARWRRSHIYKRHRDDWYVEEYWTSIRLIEVLQLAGVPISGPVLDPACGFGFIVRAAREMGLDAVGADIRPRWQQYARLKHAPSLHVPADDDFMGGIARRDFMMDLSTCPRDH
jgi:2-polyprenyl-3-methyl-5-hydroxy-6-metoxy-1,4-benzoquinol methylase